MPDINVSRDALRKVKSTLTQFKTDVSHIPVSMSRHIETTEDECGHTTNNLKNQISELAYKIKEAETKLEDLRNRYAYNQKIIKDDEAQIQNLKNQISGIEARIQSLNNQLNSLFSQLSSVETDEEKNSIQNEISRVNSEMQKQKKYLYDVEDKIKINEKEIDDLEKQNRSIQGEISTIEAELQKLKREKVRKENILDRMNVAFLNLKNELATLKNTMNIFANNALIATDNNIAGIDQCIQQIEEYMATDL